MVRQQGCHYFCTMTVYVQHSSTFFTCACCSFKQCHVSFDLFYITKTTTAPTVLKTTLSSPSTSHPSDIMCLRCQELGHMQWECSSKRTYVATIDGGYISTSDVEDDDIAAANIIGDENNHEMSEEEILDS
jgi:hypothetical protein